MTPNAYSALWFELFMPLQREEWTGKEVAFLARQLPQPRYGALLDLCCGYGRHALPLAQRGYRVTGVDRDAAAIVEARRRAAGAGATEAALTYTVADMREVGRLPGAFDAVINMWQSLAYFDDATNADLLRQIHEKLTQGGRFIVDMYNRDYFERHQGESRQTINGVTVETVSALHGDRWHSELTYRDASGERGGDHMEWRIFSPDEFGAFAHECGFTLALVCAWSDETTPVTSETARFQMALERR